MVCIDRCYRKGIIVVRKPEKVDYPTLFRVFAVHLPDSYFAKTKSNLISIQLWCSSVIK